MSLNKLPVHNAGILLYLIGVFFFALNDALGKWLMADYAVGQLLLLRAVGAAFFLVPMVWFSSDRILDFRQWRLKVLRVLCLAADAFSFFIATITLPLVDVMTYYMAAPLIITALSVPLLGERVEWYRWAAVVAGFVGVVIALQPTPAAFTPGGLIALFGAIMFALAMVMTRKIKDTPWLPMVTWQFAGAGLLGAATVPFAWKAPTGFDLGLMFLTGVVAMCCFICVTRALHLAPASLLAPFQYSSMIWAVLLGWLVWRDVPTLPIALGNAVIIGSGLFIWWQEARRGGPDVRVASADPPGP